MVGGVFWALTITTDVQTSASTISAKRSTAARKRNDEVVFTKLGPAYFDEALNVSAIASRTTFKNEVTSTPL